MPTVEAPFIIAVIREKEKFLFGDNEVTRMMHTLSMKDAREVLMSTPYAMFLQEGVSVSDALTNALETEYAWLAEHLDNEKIVAFIGARYDALHIALGIMALHNGQTHMPKVPELGILSQELLQEFIFTNSDKPDTQYQYWQDVIAREKQELAAHTWATTQFFIRIQEALEQRLQQLAKTPLMHALADSTRERHARDIELRNSPEQLNDATQYEYDWDMQAVTRAQAFYIEPTGYDPIIAYWIIKEMEVKTIRLIFAGLAGGFSREEIQALIRPLTRV